jgi:hypothetical protein
MLQRLILPPLRRCARFAPRLLVRSIQTGLIVGGLLLVGGCGNRYRPPYEIVSAAGSILYADGTPLPVPVSVQFWPQMEPVNPKEYPRPATAIVGPDGKFTSLTTWQFNDGIIPGKHKVQVLSSEGRVLPARILAPEYADNQHTPLLIEVKGDGTPVAVTVPKPR